MHRPGYKRDTLVINNKMLYRWQCPQNSSYEILLLDGKMCVRQSNFIDIKSWLVMSTHAQHNHIIKYSQTHVHFKESEQKKGKDTIEKETTKDNLSSHYSIYWKK